MLGCFCVSPDGSALEERTCKIGRLWGGWCGLSVTAHILIGCSIAPSNDPASHRLHKLGMCNTIRVVTRADPLSVGYVSDGRVFSLVGIEPARQL